MRNRIMGCEGSTEKQNALIVFSAKTFFLFAIVYVLLCPLKDIMPPGTNLVIGVFLIASLLPSLNRVQDWLVLLALAIGESITLLYCEDPAQNIDMFANVLLAVQIMTAAQNRTFVKAIATLIKKSSFVSYFSLYAYPVLLLILFLLPECWAYKDMWDGTYFTAFTVEQAVAANSCAYIALAIFTMTIRGVKWLAIVGICLGSCAIVTSGARVFIISMVILVYFGIGLFIKGVKNRRNVGVAAGILVSLLVASSQSFQIKMANAMKMQNVAGFSFIDALTNSRTIFWVNDLMAFFASDNIVKYIFGAGHDYVYAVNNVKSGYEFWAHNDFIQLLAGQGVVGFLAYVYCMLSYLKTTISYLVSKFDIVVFIIYVVCIAFLNGVLVYPNYCFSFLFLTGMFQFIAENASKKGQQ